MQWSDERHGGFTTAEEPFRPLAEGKFGPERVNVADQRRDPDSLLQWMRRIIWCRRERPELGWGSVTLVDTATPSIFAHRSDWEGGTVVAVHNLGEEPASVTLELGEDVVGVEDVLGTCEREGGERRAPGGRARSVRLSVARCGPCTRRLTGALRPARRRLTVELRLRAEGWA